MASRRTRELTIERTTRGFQQDVELAMGSDPTRAIVELVTNADDAYYRLPSTLKGKIRVEIERRRRGVPTVIRVKDRACGMTPEEMVERLAREGSRSSGFETGQDIRGLFGRGAKDIVHFGPVEFVSERDGRHATLRLEYANAPTGKAHIREDAPTTRNAHGTTVTLEVQNRFTVSRHDRLRETLSRHFALRPILTDLEHREVTLVDVGGKRSERLIYTPPRGKQLEKGLILEVPGYPGEQVILDLYESSEPLEDDLGRDYWRHSILIRSGRAAYEIMGGKLAREPWHQYLARLFGEAEVPGLRRLIKDYDDRVEHGQQAEESNPIRAVRRDRAGLAHDHPFVKAVHDAIEGALLPHLQRLRDQAEKGSESPVDDDLQRRLKQLGQLISRLLREEELDEGIEHGGGRLPPPGLSIIPGVRVVEPGSSASLLVRYRVIDEPLDPLVMVQINHDSGESTFDEILLDERDGYFSKTCSLEARGEGDATELVFSLGHFRETAVVEWRHREVPTVEKLEFEHATYAIKEGSKRQIKLLCPWPLVLGGELPERRLTGSSDIFVASGDDWLFGYDEQRDCAAFLLPISGRGVGSRARLSATLSDEVAECELSVSSSGPQGISIQIKESEVRQRAYMSEDGGTLIINAKDPSIARYLGSKRLKWPGQNQVPFRVMLAEIIVYALSRFIIQKKKQDETLTAPELFILQTRMMERWLPRVHSSLVPAGEIPTGRA